MSGTSLLSKAVDYTEHEQNYENATNALGLADMSSSERVAAILEMPASELISKLPPSILTAPAVDGDIISSALTYTQVGSLESTDLPGKSWCSDLLIGDAEADVRIVHTSRSVYLLNNFPPKIGQHI